MSSGKKKPLRSNKGSDASTGGEIKRTVKEEVKKASGKASQKHKLSVLIEESQGKKAIHSMKAITIQGLARIAGVKISIANAYLRTLEGKGVIKSLGGYSGHRIYALNELT